MEINKIHAEQLLNDYLEDEKIMENLVLEKMNEIVSYFGILQPYMPAFLDLIKWYKFSKGSIQSLEYTKVTFYKLIVND